MDLNVKNIFRKRNKFDLSHYRLMSVYMGELIPCFCEEVLPGDTFKVQPEMLVRMSPLLAPMMHEVNVYIHYFFVPNRLTWPDWPAFITGGEDGADESVPPYITSPAVTGFVQGGLADWFGLPVGVPDLQVSALPFRAYALVWNEWYRDQQLQTKVVISGVSGSDTTTSRVTLNRNWEKDYYTSCRIAPQLGDDVYLPLGVSAPVDGSNINVTAAALGANGVIELYNRNTTTPATANTAVKTNAANNRLDVNGQYVYMDPGGTLIVDPTSGSLEADLTDATAATINEIRQAFQIQKWQERNNRSGNRYIESILAHFGIRSSDARLQRPEYLGGAKSRLMISEVLQTSEEGTTPQGNMAGHGISALQGAGFTKSFEEHGIIIGILSVTPRTVYQQGLARSWSRTTRYDYYWPEFANLGEQAVLNQEIYAAAASPTGVFGFQSRYEEYRRRENSVHGMFRDQLDYWHMSRQFDSEPALNNDFVACVPTMRQQAVEDEPNCYVQLLNRVTAIRPLPKLGTPGLIDHN